MILPTHQTALIETPLQPATSYSPLHHAGAAYRIIDCKHIPPYGLQLRFDDGLERVVDLENILEGQIYRPLRDEELFSKVVIDPEIRTVTWPNGADFDPTVLHDWPMHQEAFVCAARNWKSSWNFKNTPYAELAESGV